MNEEKILLFLDEYKQQRLREGEEQGPRVERFAPLGKSTCPEVGQAT
jgi:hypothetical protein